jgi:sulfur carrier protein ThiS
MMAVTVTMWGNLRRFLPDGVGSTTLQLPESSTIEDIASQLAAEHEVWAVALNGRIVPFATRLSPGDHVICFDHLHGG